jgi:hypothetical protein
MTARVNTCSVGVHTKFQPKGKQFCCPKCGAGLGDFYLELSEDEGSCCKLHEKDMLACDICRQVWTGKEFSDLHEVQRV